VAGDIAIEVNASTVTLAVALTDPSVQVMVTGPPIDTPFTIPIPLTDATPVAEDIHIAKGSICSLLPSLNVPIACKLSVEFRATPALAGVSVIFVRVPGPTSRGTDPITPSNVAEIIVDPAANAVATPIFGLVLLIVAAVGLLLDQATFCVMFCWVTSCVLGSRKLPTAV
jgi:hypothetical protein